MKRKLLLPCMLLFVLGNGIVKGQIISTIAGTGTLGFSGDGGAAVSAQLNDPYGVAIKGTVILVR